MPGSANSIITPQAPKSATASSATANTNYTVPTNTLLLVTAGANGGRLTRLNAIPRGTVGATQLQIFSSLDGGVTLVLIDTALMTAYTMAQTTESPTTDFGYSDDNPLILSAAERLYIAIGVSMVGGIVFRAEWADY